METHSNTLAWKIPWMEEPGRLQSMGSQRVGHNWETSVSQYIAFVKSQLLIYLLSMFPHPVVQMVKNLPVVRETQVQSLGQEDPLEKGMATYFSILAWRIPWTEKPGRLQSMGLHRVGHNWVTVTSFHFHTINTHTQKQNELYYSCFLTVHDNWI